MKVCIFGCGFVGEAAADLFYREGADVTAVVQTPESFARLTAVKPYQIQSGDLSRLESVRLNAMIKPVPNTGQSGPSKEERSTESTRREFASASAEDSPSLKPDLVVHCASSNGGDATAYRSVYLNGVRNLIRVFPDARLIYTGSTSVYAQTDESWVDESSQTDPSREQGQVLLDAEREVTAAGGVVLRLAGIYGPGRCMLIRKFLDGSAIIEEGGSRWINQIHRDDAASAILFLARRTDLHGVFNGSDNSPARQRDIYAWLAKELGQSLPPNGPRPLVRSRAWTSKRVSNAKLREAGWEPTFSTFREGYRDVLAK